VARKSNLAAKLASASSLTTLPRLSQKLAPWYRDFDSLRRGTSAEPLFLVGHGRDGSTLLQHLINSANPRVEIRGENIIGLQIASMIGTLTTERWFQPRPLEDRLESKNPWFGADQVDVPRIVRQAKNLVETNVLSQSKGLKLVGFKEIRWFDLPHTFVGMERMFPNAKYIFIERDVDAMKLSGWWPQVDDAEQEILKRHKLAKDMRTHLDDRAMLVRYENIISNTGSRESVEQFCGVELSKPEWEIALGQSLIHNGGRPPWSMVRGPVF
jgi:hypothetical protein